jgi:DNA gyrase subunit A
MISLLVPDERGAVLTVSENGYGKRTAVGDFPTKGRAGKGVIAMASSERNGRLVGAVQVFPGDELMLISNQGTAGAHARRRSVRARSQHAGCADHSHQGR